MLWNNEDSGKNHPDVPVFPRLFVWGVSNSPDGDEIFSHHPAAQTISYVDVDAQTYQDHGSDRILCFTLF